MSMAESSPGPIESTRKAAARIRAEIGQRLAVVTQARAADLMEVSASTVSRTVADLDQLCQLLAAIGLQVAPLDAMVMSPQEIEAMELMAYKYLQTRIETRGRDL